MFLLIKNSILTGVEQHPLTKAINKLQIAYAYKNIKLFINSIHTHIHSGQGGVSKTHPCPVTSPWQGGKHGAKQGRAREVLPSLN